MLVESRVPPRPKTHLAAASRRSPCAAATPRGAFEVANRLQYTISLALSNRTTAPGDLLPTPASSKRPDLWEGPPPSTVGNTSSTAARRRLKPNRRPRPENRHAPPVELLAPAATEAAGGRQKPKLGRALVASPQDGANDFLNNPPHSRALCRSKPRERSGKLAFGWASCRSRSKSEMCPLALEGARMRPALGWLGWMGTLGFLQCFPPPASPACVAPAVAAVRSRPAATVRSSAMQVIPRPQAESRKGKVGSPVAIGSPWLRNSR